MRYALLYGEEGTSGPVVPAWRSPVTAAADRGKVAARYVIFSPADRGVKEAAGNVVGSRAD